MILVAFFMMIFFYSLVSRRLERSVVTAPILFSVGGMLLLLVAPGLRGMGGNRELFLRLAEMGLVMLLFSDASRTDLQVLRSIRNLPARLLSAGMLLTILLGAVAAMTVFPGLSLLEAGILAAILAPTDAGLGQVIVNSPQVPMRIRQALNVEAGLNDGLCVPFLMCFIALAQHSTEGAGTVLTRFIVEQLGYGVLVGAGIGLVGGYLLDTARRKEWIATPLQQLGLVTLPVLCLITSEHVGASMFIAAFVCGLAVQVRLKEAGRHSLEFTESWGRLLNDFVFFFFGLLVAGAWDQFTFAVVLYALLSLTVVRMLPVGIALVGARLGTATVLFMGWFGPRGLASIVLGLVYLEKEAHLPGEPIIRLAVAATVLLSIFAHGLSALPGINLYARTLGMESQEPGK
jgi:NhaP-type Na+/H+ or K+/H+ antiporter